MGLNPKLGANNIVVNPNKTLSADKVAKYYKIEQDNSIKNLPDIQLENKFKTAFFDKRELPHHLNLLNVKEKPGVENNYPAYLDRPVLLVNDTFKKVIYMYHKDLDCQPVVLTEKVASKQNVYWHIRVPETDCLSPKSIIGHDKLIKKVVIDVAKSEDKSFIKIVNNIQSIYVVRLDLLESALRRDLCGFVLEELECE